MDEKLFECAVCLEMCRECINCQQCNQILCKSHAQDLDRCPCCRAEPFRFTENVALQRIITELKTRMGTLTPPPSPRQEPGALAAAASGVASAFAGLAAAAGYAMTAAPAAEEGLDPAPEAAVDRTRGEVM